MFFSEHIIPTNVLAIIFPSVTQDTFTCDVMFSVAVQVVSVAFVEVDHVVVAAIYILSGNHHKTRSFNYFLTIVRRTVLRVVDVE